MQNVIALKQVVIKADREDNSIYGAGANACGDYVCKYGYINCINHPNDAGNRQPQQGKSYRGRLYWGCVGERETMIKINSFYLSREFYGVNTDPAGMLEPQFFSTLFWRPGVVTDINGKAEVSFFTGDVTGKFRVIVQGISQNDVVFGEAMFSVK